MGKYTINCHAIYFISISRFSTAKSSSKLELSEYVACTKCTGNGCSSSELTAEAVDSSNMGVTVERIDSGGGCAHGDDVAVISDDIFEGVDEDGSCDGIDGIISASTKIIRIVGNKN